MQYNKVCNKIMPYLFLRELSSWCVFFAIRSNNMGLRVGKRTQQKGNSLLAPNDTEFMKVFVFD